MCCLIEYLLHIILKTNTKAIGQFTGNAQNPRTNFKSTSVTIASGRCVVKACHRYARNSANCLFLCFSFKALFTHYPAIGNPESRTIEVMDEMFLKDVEQHRGDNNYSRAIEVMRSAGQEYPQILHMFAYKMQATVHLERFTQEILREPAPLSPGLRELIAAYTSSLNQCPF